MTRTGWLALAALALMHAGQVSAQPDATLRHISGSMGAWDWTEEARRVRAPTLVIQGDMDVVAPAAGGVEWARLISGARLLSVPGAGHLAWAEAPSVVLPALERFLDGDWPNDARRVD